LAKAGAITNVVIGGTGRRIDGRVNLTGGENSDVDWKRDVHRLTLSLPGAATPGVLNLIMRAPAVVDQSAQRTYVLVFETNGVFHADHVPPGKYQLQINVSDPEDEYYNRRYIGTATKEVTVPEERNAKVNAPLDIGAIDLAIRPRVKPGQVVPSFEMKGADGKTIKLSELRGKYVLLHFWGQSLGWNSTDFTVLRELQSSYGANGKLVILGCNLDPPQGYGTEQFIRSQNMTWKQTLLGNWNETPIPGMFGLQGNTAAILIDPQGRLVSGQLRGTSIRSFVQNALAGGVEP
jgi:hypothetical protein